MSITSQYIYSFDNQRVDGSSELKDLLGGKGAGLAGMSMAGLPVPPGFTISTDAHAIFNRDPHAFERQVWPQVLAGIKRLEQVSRKSLGDATNPLLLSIRSGAKYSMPGMMDTVLNVGLNDEIVRSMVSNHEDPKFVFDSYRRLLQMFGNVVLDVPLSNFENLLHGERAEQGVEHDIELHAQILGKICSQFKNIIATRDKVFPLDPREQVRLAVEAVFKSWDNSRAVTYRKLNDIPNDLGTAVTVQMMVFGNRGVDSGSGVGFTRNPATGEPILFGEFLPRSQGEEVVAGIRTPLGLEEVEKNFPDAYKQLSKIVFDLETFYRDMQDFEFVIEKSTLYMLQTRTGKRTGLAAVRIACDMLQEGLISDKEALLRVTPDQLNQLLHPQFNDDGAEVFTKGLNASPGAVVGRIVFSSRKAIAASKNYPVILVRNETSPDDLAGMNVAEGILTSRGGVTSHAAVVARGMGKCCVVGAGDVRINEEKKEMRVGEVTVQEGEYISLDGTRGLVFLGQISKGNTASNDGLLEKFLNLAGKYQKIQVRANADTPVDALKALEYGAVGIGLCRTEHMFLGVDRLPIMQDLLLSENEEERKEPLKKLQKFQKDDFKAILAIMNGLPVNIRLLDPPLHEFLPEISELRTKVRQLKEKKVGIKKIRKIEKLLERAIQLQESNPMLGHRGCRLGITYPDITCMQVKALFSAACELKSEGKSPIIEVMIPLVSLVEEFRHQAKLVRGVARAVFEDCGIEVPFEVGSMIELPRFVLIADQVALDSDFFSFGTNDLTQATFGFSRDDTNRFLPYYLENKILKSDPFQTLDLDGVGVLVSTAIKKGRDSRNDLKVGICGEHGGDPRSIEFFHKLNMDYVSCSPYRVPIARLAGSQSVIKEGR